MEEEYEREIRKEERRRYPKTIEEEMEECSFIEFVEDGTPLIWVNIYVGETGKPKLNILKLLLLQEIIELMNIYDLFFFRVKF